MANTDLQPAIRDLVNGFVERLEAAVRRSVLEELLARLASGDVGPGRVARAAGSGVVGRRAREAAPVRPPAGPRGKSAAAAAPAKARPVKARPAKPSAKSPASVRSGEIEASPPSGRGRFNIGDLEATGARIADYVASRPGASAVAIRAALGLDERAWRLAIKWAVSGGRLVAHGDGAEATYTLAG